MLSCTVQSAISLSFVYICYKVRLELDDLITHMRIGLGCTDAYNIRVRVYTGVHTCPR